MYVTLITVQNDTRCAVCTLLRISTEDY